MTIRIPKPSMADRFLRILGKRRAVQLPSNMGQFGDHFQAVGIKESFWKALIRPKNRKLPESTVNIFLVGN
jgi:hypothetical protein